jgi:hypothetical protein
MFTQAQLDSFIANAPRHNSPGRTRKPQWTLISEPGRWVTFAPKQAYRIYQRQNRDGERAYFADLKAGKTTKRWVQLAAQDETGAAQEAQRKVAAMEVTA